MEVAAEDTAAGQSGTATAAEPAGTPPQDTAAGRTPRLLPMTAASPELAPRPRPVVTSSRPCRVRDESGCRRNPTPMPSGPPWPSRGLRKRSADAAGRRQATACRFHGFLPGADAVPRIEAGADLDHSSLRLWGRVAGWGILTRNAALFADASQTIDHHASNGVGPAWIDPGALPPARWSPCSPSASESPRSRRRGLRDPARGRDRDGHGDLRPPNATPRTLW
jgi:hypothetical protein